MNSIKLLLYIFFCCTIGFTSAYASQINDAKKCTSVSDPNERLKCFDQIFLEKPATTNTKSNSSGLSVENADMLEMLNTSLQKGEFETTGEFRDRILELYNSYDAKTYEIELNIEDHNTEHRKLAKYNPDSEILSVSMPELEFTTVGIQMNEKADDYHITLSYIETKSLQQDISKYTATNQFGTEVEVVKEIFSDMGLAILGESNRDMNGQTFSVKVPRDKAKSILKNGRVRITVKTDLIKRGNNSFMLDTWMTWESKGASILITEKYEREPTMTDPHHIIRERVMLPVRLLSMALIDETGKEIKNAKGTQINTNYFRQ